MKNKISYAKHFFKKILCDAYLSLYSDREIESYRRNHIEKMNGLKYD